MRTLGLLQPIADAAKLFLKERVTPLKSNNFLFYVAPLIILLLSLLLWRVIPSVDTFMAFQFDRILFILMLSFGTYPLFLSGWASNRKYAITGALRGVAQTISYEIRLALILIAFLLTFQSYKLVEVSWANKELIAIGLLPVLALVWIISCVAETNRTPFDFSEGESELVSGFNVEYGRRGFTIIFIAEYSIILLFRFLRSRILLLRVSLKIPSLIGITALVCFWVWIRASFPRYRYDKLISMAWKKMLPLRLIFIVWVIAFRFLI